MNFSRRVQPQRPSQMTGCLNAGTGCGWCIPFLIKLAQNPDAFPADDLKPEEYAERRKNYIKTAPKNKFEDLDAASAETPYTKKANDTDDA